MLKLCISGLFPIFPFLSVEYSTSLKSPPTHHSPLHWNLHLHAILLRLNHLILEFSPDILTLCWTKGVDKMTNKLSFRLTSLSDRRTDQCQEIRKKSKFHPINMPPVPLVGWWILPTSIPTSSNRPVQSSSLLPQIDPILFLSNWIFCFLDHYDFCFEFPGNLFDWGTLTEAPLAFSIPSHLRLVCYLMRSFLDSPWFLSASVPKFILNIFSEILRNTSTVFVTLLLPVIILFPLWLFLFGVLNFGIGTNMMANAKCHTRQRTRKISKTSNIIQRDKRRIREDTSDQTDLGITRWNASKSESPLYLTVQCFYRWGKNLHTGRPLV